MITNFMGNIIKDYLQSQKDIGEFLKRNDLTRTQFNTILYLGCYGESSVGEIPGGEKSDSLLSREISKLWKRDIVSKQIPEDNQRLRLINLRPKGKELYLSAQNLVEILYK